MKMDAPIADLQCSYYKLMLATSCGTYTTDKVGHVSAHFEHVMSPQVFRVRSVYIDQETHLLPIHQVGVAVQEVA